MYSWQIERLIKLRNELLEAKEYLEISDVVKNPQITHIVYNSERDIFQIYTNDDYCLNFKVKKLENKETRES